MKKLEKTERILITSTLFILIIVIALLVYKKPDFLYKVNTVNTLEQLIDKDFTVSLNDIYAPNIVLIDIRDQIEFEKAHLENSINISSPKILDKTSITIFDKLKSEHKTVILYGNSPEDITAQFMLLYQLGYNNIKILAAENTYFQNNLFAKRIEIEKSENDVNAFIAESIKITDSLKQKVVVKKLAPKPKSKIIVKKKKKKMPMEGGC